MIRMNPAPCASSLFCPPCPSRPRVTEPLQGLRDLRGGGTCSDSPGDSSQSPSRTCRADLGEHLEDGSGSLAEENVHLFEAEDDACPLSGLQSHHLCQIHCYGRGGCSFCGWVRHLLDQSPVAPDLCVGVRLSSLRCDSGDEREEASCPE